MNQDNTIESQDFEDRYRAFTEKVFFDITNGFPFYTSQELYDVLFTYMIMRDNISRLPILATEEGVYIQTQPRDERLEHKVLVEELAIRINEITFGSGIEGVTTSPPSGEIYISVPHVFDGEHMLTYWLIKKNSDKYGKSIFREDKYLEQLKDIFEKIEGVKFHYPLFK